MQNLLFQTATQTVSQLTQGLTAFFAHSNPGHVLLSSRTNLNLAEFQILIIMFQYKFKSSKFRDYLRPTPHQVQGMHFKAGERGIAKNSLGLNQVPGLPVTFEGAPWFEHGTYRSAVDCSTTELYTRLVLPHPTDID